MAGCAATFVGPQTTLRLETTVGQDLDTGSIVLAGTLPRYSAEGTYTLSSAVCQNSATLWSDDFVRLIPASKLPRFTQSGPADASPPTILSVTLNATTVSTALAKQVGESLCPHSPL